MTWENYFDSIRVFTVIQWPYGYVRIPSPVENFAF
jgi:hypothetical protein